MAANPDQIATMLALIGAGTGVTEASTGDQIGLLLKALGSQKQEQSGAVVEPSPTTNPVRQHTPLLPAPAAPGDAPNPMPLGASIPQRAIDAVTGAESSGNPIAKSKKGAMGLMQLMPRTAEEYAGKLGMEFSPEMLFDPQYNQTLGTAVLDDYTKKFGGDTGLGLAAYNAGPTRVRAALGEGQGLAAAYPNLPKETQDYVMKIATQLQGGMGPPNLYGQLW